MLEFGMMKNLGKYERLSKIKGFWKKVDLGWLQVMKRLKDLRDRSRKKEAP
jgi:hypothetical protein